MKKNISINISGIIFHIEEDGYESLRKYLDSINQYFGSFEDSSEILADIENRIAEIFLSKLSEGKQVISLEDVQSLKATMGNVSDFKAAEEQEVGNEQAKSENYRQPSPIADTPPIANKRLFRDAKRKILGGVCAGLGHYFNIDPVWPRVLFALLALGSYGGLVIVYILCWIAIPPSDELTEEATIKKMYRDQEKKVLGGVASGVAAFFGTDVTVIRILFILLSFVGGLGLLLYIILWIALPEAKTITEKMEMQGEPVTLSNIESSVKKGINEKGEEESALAKIILFPFRLIATFITALGKILGPLVKLMVDLLRVFIGLVLVMLGLALLVAVVISFGVFFGFFSAHVMPESWGMGLQGLSLPMDAIRNTFPLWLFVVAFIALLIPCLSFILSGSSVITNRKIVGAPVVWSLVGLFVISAIILTINIPRIVYSFKEDAEFKTEKIFNVASQTIVMKVTETGLDDYRVADLTLRGYEGKEVKLVQRFISQGATRKNAIENAQMIDYRVNQQDSVLEFDSNVTFKKDAKFHAQRLEMVLYIPYRQKFKVDSEMWRLIDNYNQYDNDSDIYYNGYQYSGYYNSNEQTWEMTEEGIKCVSCPEKPKSEQGLDDNDQYGLRDFKEIEIKGIFDLRIRQSERFSIELEGPDREKQKYTVNVSGETLEIDYESRGRTFWEKDVADDRVKMTILLPSLSKLKITGAGEFNIVGFDEEEMKIVLKGAMVGDAEINAQNLDLQMIGPMVFELDGKGRFLQAEVTGLAQLKAGQYQVEDAVVEAKKLGRARVNAASTLEMDTDAVSSIKYQGNPEVTRRD
jgi:phage shock protein PspC (stress-responsive transcriptional regulator)